MLTGSTPESRPPCPGIPNYVDDSILDILTVVNPQVRVRILTEYLPRDFSTAIKKFLVQRQIPIEVKLQLRKIHDRFIMLDENKGYSLGASIKDAGKKLWLLHRLDDRVQLAKLKNLLSSVWNSADPIWPPP
jgi:hypothetical protein